MGTLGWVTSGGCGRGHPWMGAVCITTALLACGGKEQSGGDATGASTDATADASTTPPKHLFPKTFLWGTATAGFQVEAGCPTLPAEQCEDRSSDWYQWVTDPDLGADKANYVSGQPLSAAPGMWETYDADFQAARKQLHNGAVRVSLEWSRLFPDGKAENAKSLEELDKLAHAGARDAYRAMFAAARKHKLTLLVTVNHYTLPLWVHDGKACNKDPDTCQASGWLQPTRMVPLIALYAGWCARTFGDSVDLWGTINEPFAVVLSGYLLPSADRTNPPGIYFAWDKGVKVAFAMMEAHAKMYDAIHAHDGVDVDGDGRNAAVGLVPNLVAMHPANPDNPDDLVAVEHLSHVYNRVFLEATVLGKLDRNLDGVFEEDRPDMKGRMDWIGINYYTRILAQKKPIPGADKLFPYLDSSPDLAAGVWQDYPEGLAEVVRWASKNYGLPIYITENGTAKDKSTAWETFFRPHLLALHGVMQEPGVDVRGYFVWSLVDNYEWNHGMGMRFGLLAVDDTPAKSRTLTAAGEAYGAAAQRNGLD